MTAGEALLVAVAGLGAGFVNGVAGGGTLLAFPALIAADHSALVANVTTSVGIFPGYVGGVAAFRAELRDQRRRVRALAPAALLGGVAGSLLLLVTSEDAFEDVAPFLVLAACALFAVQPRLAERIAARRAGRPPGAAAVPTLALAGTFVASVYGGYFGAGLGVLLLAVLGLALTDSLVRINGLRGLLSLLVSSISVVVFALSGDVAWAAAGTLAGTSLVGGYAGARLSRRMPVHVLRGVVIAFGLTVAVLLLAS